MLFRSFLSCLDLYCFMQKLQLNDKLEESSKRTSDSVGQASKKKHGYLYESLKLQFLSSLALFSMWPILQGLIIFCWFHRKLKKASSSVVLIKNIPPPSKKNGTGIAKNFLKPFDRQCQLNNQPNTVVWLQIHLYFPSLE